MCSKKASVNSVQPPIVSDYADTIAVRAILDANGFSTISAGSPTITLIGTVGPDNNYHRVIELNLGNKGITTIPSQIKSLTAMTILRLDTNNITALPAEIGKCTSLVRIQLDSNRLATLPTEISLLHSLSSLILSHNLISTLPASLWTCTALSQLDLDYNQLDSISSQVSNLVNLGRLSLSSNSLTTLPVSMQQSAAFTASLQYIQVDNNHICATTLGASFAAWVDNRSPDNWESTQGTCP
jgi:Leucine-rich repeat (LRR) protein